MTGVGHKITGFCSAIFAVSVMPTMSFMSALMLGIACVFGATAPDWLEVAWMGNDGRRKSVIPHRKITHWIPLWIGLLYYGVKYLNGAHSYLVIGFAVGGLTHLICDVPNPMGVPLIHPWRNVSLNLWKSGQNEKIIIACFLMVDFMSLVDLRFYKNVFF